MNFTQEEQYFSIVQHEKERRRVFAECIASRMSDGKLPTANCIQAGMEVLSSYDQAFPEPAEISIQKTLSTQKPAPVAAEKAPEVEKKEPKKVKPATRLDPSLNEEGDGLAALKGLSKKKEGNGED
jgi:hypothetical protein